MKCAICATLSAPICSPSPSLRLPEREGDDRQQREIQQSVRIGTGRRSLDVHPRGLPCLDPFSYLVTFLIWIWPYSNCAAHRSGGDARRNCLAKFVASLPIRSKSLRGPSALLAAVAQIGSEADNASLRQTCRACKSARPGISTVVLTTQCSYPAMNKSC